MSKYSIILPVRNGGNYVKECVNSVLSQTYTDFNFIILDNCSTDGTLEWLYSLKDNRIKIITSEKPLTIEENWGRIKNAEKNEFITLIGHDDILYPRFLATIDILVQKNPGAGLYHTHFNFIDADSKIIRSSKKMQSFFSFNELLKGFLNQTVDSMGTGYVMRSIDYDAVGGIPVKYPNLLFADFELWLNMAAKGGMVVSDEILFGFRVHQSTTTQSQDNKLHNALSLYIDFLVELKRKDTGASAVINEFGCNLLMFYCRGFSHRLLRTPVRKRNGITVSLFIDETKKMALKLGLQKKYNPESLFSIRLAKIIDGNAILRNVFIAFKKIYSKPVL